MAQVLNYLKAYKLRVGLSSILVVNPPIQAPHPLNNGIKRKDFIRAIQKSVQIQ